MRQVRRHNASAALPDRIDGAQKTMLEYNAAFSEMFSSQVLLFAK